MSACLSNGEGGGRRGGRKWRKWSKTLPYVALWWRVTCPLCPLLRLTIAWACIQSLRHLIRPVLEQPWAIYLGVCVCWVIYNFKCGSHILAKENDSTLKLLECFVKWYGYLLTTRMRSWIKINVVIKLCAMIRLATKHRLRFIYFVRPWLINR